MLITARTNAHALAVQSRIDPSTVEKGLRRYRAGKSRRGPHQATLEKLRAGMRAWGYAEWEGGPFDIRRLVVALRATIRAYALDDPDAAEVGARMLSRVYAALSRREGLSDESSEAAADLLAQELRIDIARDET